MATAQFTRELSARWAEHRSTRPIWRALKRGAIAVAIILAITLFFFAVMAIAALVSGV